MSDMQTRRSHIVLIISCILMIFPLIALFINLDWRYFGIYPHGHRVDYNIPLTSRDFWFVTSAPNFLAYLITLTISAWICVIFFKVADLVNSNQTEKIHGYKRKTAILLTILTLILYTYKLTGDYVVIMDSYEILDGSLEIFYEKSYYLEHKCPPGASITLAPIILIKPDEFLAQCGIITYAFLLFVVSYYFWNETFKENKLNAFATFFVAIIIINPMYVVLSRTVNYEIILLFYFVLMSLLLFKIIDNDPHNYLTKQHVKFILVAVLSTFLGIIRFPYYLINLLVLIFAFILALRSTIIAFRQRTHNTRKIIINLIIWGIVLLSDTFLALITIKFFQPPAPKGFISYTPALNLKNLKRMLPVSTYVLLSLMNNLPYRTFFGTNIIRVTYLNILFFPLNLYVILLGIRCGLKNSKSRIKILFLVATSVSLIWFFATYRSWQARYLTIPLYILSLFYLRGIIEVINIAHKTLRIEKNTLKSSCALLTKFTEKINITSCEVIVLSFILLFMLGVVNSSNSVCLWNTYPSYYENMSQIFPSELEEIIITVAQHEPAIIFTTYEAAIEFYVYKFNANVKVFFIWRYYVENGFTNESAKEIINLIKEYLKAGYSVWYLAGWPEIDHSKPAGAVQNMGELFEIIKDDENLEFIVEMIGEDVPRKSWRHIAPAYILYEIILA